MYRSALPMDAITDLKPVPTWPVLTDGHTVVTLPTFSWIAGHLHFRKGVEGLFQARHGFPMLVPSTEPDPYQVHVPLTSEELRQVVPVLPHRTDLALMLQANQQADRWLQLVQQSDEGFLDYTDRDYRLLASTLALLTLHRMVPSDSDHMDIAGVLHLRLAELAPLYCMSCFYRADPSRPILSPMECYADLFYSRSLEHRLAEAWLVLCSPCWHRLWPLTVAALKTFVQESGRPVQLELPALYELQVDRLSDPTDPLLEQLFQTLVQHGQLKLA